MAKSTKSYKTTSTPKTTSKRSSSSYKPSTTSSKSSSKYTPSVSYSVPKSSKTTASAGTPAKYRRTKDSSRVQVRRLDTSSQKPREITTTTGRKYKKAKVVAVCQGGIEIIHAYGGKFLKTAMLPEKIQKEFGLKTRKD